MRPENMQIITTSTTGGTNDKKTDKGLKSNDNIHSIQSIYTNGNNDNIITISTASLNDYNPELNRDRTIVTPIKKQQIFSIKLPQFLTPAASDGKKSLQQSQSQSQSQTQSQSQSQSQSQQQLLLQLQHQQQQNKQNSQHQLGLNETNSNASTAAASIDHLNLDSYACSKWISFQDNIADVQHRKGRRLHGLQLPLHPLQVFGWIVLLLFGIASYYVLIPTFNSTLQGPLYGLITGLYIVHIISHLTALLSDPADKELRRIHRNDRIVPEFDRNKHAHVIENGRCHLCNIKTSSPRTKHCSVCNKCVGKFDHHCKWLNHCIGSRNYVAFLMCVVSAVIATLVIVAAVIAQIVLYYVQPEWLNFWYLKSLELDNTTSLETTLNLNSKFNLSATQVTSPSPLLSLSSSSSLSSTVLNDFINNETFIETFNVTDSIILTNNITNTSYIYSINNFDLDNETNTNTNINNYNNNNNFDFTTLPSLMENFTTLLAEHFNETLKSYPKDYQENNLNSLSSAKNVTATFAGISLNDTIFLILLGVLGLLAAITAGLLLHLCFFHIYISFLGLTTYEYIRNHRQAQEAKAKLGLTNNTTATTTSTISTTNQTDSPLNKKTKTNCGQIYCCSNLRHPNSIDPIDQNYFDSHNKKRNSENSTLSESLSSKFLKLHCCANSREYHQTALKTYYMCSLLEESTPINANALHLPSSLTNDYCNDITSPEINSNNFKTFHCCSSFAATTTQRRVSAATSKATLVSDLEAATASALSVSAAAAAHRSYLQFTEQCTLCTFRIRSPLLSSRKISAASSTRTQSTAAVPNTKPSSAASQLSGSEYKRCCMKSISKHQRWRRKWNCCSAVPDSPDVPNDIITALNLRHQHSAASVSGNITNSNDNKKLNATDIPVHFIKTVHNSSGGSIGENNQDANNSLSSSPRSAKLKQQVRTRNARTWPVARLRHMVRIFSRYRTRNNPSCRHQNTTAAGFAEQIKQNQIRPLQMPNPHNLNGCYQYQQSDYDSSSPQPPSTATQSERSSEPSIYSDSSNLTTPSSGIQPTTIETILPTSHIGEDTSTTYTTPIGIILPPALPPPTRRKIPNPTDLEELAETLGFSSHPSNGSMTFTPSQRLPALNNVYRRQRRKHFLRTRSPTLSPIHESGLSNPTSPQPLRHNTSASNTCSPTSINNLNNNSLGSGDIIRKTLSNTSLHSVSSNSSST